MGRIVVYDKVSWHYPEGKKCPSLSAATKHFEVLMGWLKDNQLLSEEGDDVFKFDIDADFSINSSMLNWMGKKIMDDVYSSWVGNINYGGPIDLTMFNTKLDSFKSRRVVKENFGSEVRLEPTIADPTIVEEIRGESAAIEKQIDGILINQEIEGSAEEDTSLLQVISESLGDGEVSEEHAETLELVTEHFSRKWGVEHRTLGRESFGDTIKLLAVAVAPFAVVLGIFGLLTSTIKYLFKGLYEKTSKLDNMVGDVEITRELLEGPLITDAGLTSLGKRWIKPLTKGSIFIGDDPDVLMSEIVEIADPSSIIDAVEEIVDVMNSGVVEDAISLSERYMGMYPSKIIPVFNNKVVTIGTREFLGRNVIVSAKVIAAQGKPPKTTKTFTVGMGVEIVELLKTVVSNYTGDGKLKSLDNMVNVVEKEITKLARNGTEDEKITASICAALLNIVIHTKLLATKYLIEGGTDYLDVAFEARREHFREIPNLI